MEELKKPTKVTREIAQADVESWLDKKKVFEATRETYQEYIDTQVSAIMAGNLILDQEKNVYTHKLLFPEDFNGELNELIYKPRLNDRMLKPHMQGVKAGDADGRLLAYGAALTNKPKSLLESLDTADKKLMMSIVIFFL